jgi:uncharacterized protein YjdB/uncharacterized protein YkwD
MKMKKHLILLLVGGLLLGTSSGVFAEELIPLPEMVDTDIMQTTQVSEDTLETNALPVFPSSYPSGYYSYTTEAKVDGAGAVELVEKMNALRVSKGRKPLVLDDRLTKAAMYRASEISLVYLHKAPDGGWGQPDYYFSDGSAENIVIGRNSGTEAYNAFEASGGHNVQMMQPYWTRVGVGNYGGAWVLTFDADYNTMSSITRDVLISKYTSNGRVVRTVVDQSSSDGTDGDGLNRCYNPHPCVDSTYAQSKNMSINKGITQQLNAYVVPHPYDTLLNQYPYLETKIVPSSVKWSTSNQSVATVDSNGIVTGRTAGTAVISGVVGAETLKYNITVTGNGTTPTDLDPNFLVKYRTHVQDVGWQSYVADGSVAGTSGRSLRLEGINIDLNDNIVGNIEYRTHVQNIGWQNYVANNAMSGTSGLSYRLEAINIRLTGEAATKFDIYYRVHTQNIGWMGWAKNDEPSGSAGFSYRLEGIEIKVVPKGSPAPGSTVNAFVQNVI